MTPELPSSTLTMAKMSKSSMTAPTRLSVVGSISVLLYEVEFFESFPLFFSGKCNHTGGVPVTPGSLLTQIRGS